MWRANGFSVAQIADVARKRLILSRKPSMWRAKLDRTMPKQIPKSELEIIVDIVASYEDGATLDEIASRLPFSVSRRTLQRRLARLIEENKLRVSGEGRGTRYVLDIEREKSKRSEQVKPDNAPSIPLTPISRTLKETAMLPTTQRHPVGYNREFLEDYQPDRSFYLTEDIRRHLREISGTTETEMPAGTYARHVLSRLLIDLSWNSSRLEGNTYSLLETERLIELGEQAEGRSVTEAQMILNHKAAIELLVEQAEEIGFNHYTICGLHALLSDNLLADPRACGRIRGKSIGITGSVYHPADGEKYVEELFQLLLRKGKEIHDPFEQSFFAMVHIPYLQPFEDVNKRVSRLAANIPLIRRNLVPLSFVDVPHEDYVRAILTVYEQNRVEYLRDVYVWAYERSCARYSAVRRSLGEPDPFRLKYRNAIGELVREIVQDTMVGKETIERIRTEASRSIPSKDRARFIEVVETELMSLHEGNIARYRLRPSEYFRWREKNGKQSR